MLGFIVTLLVITVSLLVAIRVSIGLDVDNARSALLAALTVGLVNAALRPLLGTIHFQSTFWSFGLFTFLLNIPTLYLTAAFVKHFYVRNVMAAIIASLFLATLNTLIYLLSPFLGS
jgi:putative membrane protein